MPKTFQPKLGERLRTYASGMGPATAREAILSWVARAEAHDPRVGDFDALAELTRSVVVLAYVRGFYCARQTDDGFEVELVASNNSAFFEALQLQMQVNDAFVVDPAVSDALTSILNETGEEILEQLSLAFSSTFNS